MTTYLLRSPEGTVSKWTMPELTFKNRLDKQGRYRHVSGIDGSVVLYEPVGVHAKRGAAATTRTWVMKSDAMGINPDQRLDAMKADEQLGIKIEYDEAGRAVFRSPNQYKRYCEAHGFFDRNAGYSGAQKRDAREREILNLPELVNEYD